MFDMWVIATILVRGVSSFSNSSIRKLPSSSTGAQLITAPWRSRRKCHGTMLEWCSMIESTISSPACDALAPERIGDEIDRLGGVAGEDDLLAARGVEEAAHRLARALVAPRSRRWRGSAARDARWRIRTCRRDRAGRAQPSASAPTPHCRDRPAACRRPHGEDREILADAGDIVSAVGDRRMHGHASLALSQAATCSISASRRPACSMPSTASPTNACTSSASASGSGMPRAIR